MSAGNCFLSPGPYGYDVVLATTQASLNATLKLYLGTISPPQAVVCWVTDGTGAIQIVDYDTLKQNAKGTDPFAVPTNADPATSQDLQNLAAANFVAGFKAQVGLPPGYAPTEIPDAVTLDAGPSAVTYSMLCSEFVVAQYTPASGSTSARWMNTSQPAGAAWVFGSRLNLGLTPTSEFGALPAAVQAQIKNLGSSAFSVQQLLLDLGSFALAAPLTIPGVEAGSSLYGLLQNEFPRAYFAALEQAGPPVLGCAVTQPAAPATPLTLTDLGFGISPFTFNGAPVPNPTPAQQALYTLNYLGATNGHTLPAPAPFTWNWVDEGADYDGAVAISRSVFTSYLQSQLDPLVQKNCFIPSVVVTRDGGNASFQLSVSPGGTPAVTVQPGGPRLLSYSWSQTAQDQAGLGGDVGSAVLTPSYTLDVDAAAGAIAITQHLLVRLDATKNLFSSVGANVADVTIVDIYTLAVDENGSIAPPPPQSQVTDNSQDATGSDIFGLSDDVQPLVAQCHQMAATSLQFISLQVFQDLVFPGGNTFAFKNVTLSPNNDLAAQITYTDPS